MGANSKAWAHTMRVRLDLDLRRGRRSRSRSSRGSSRATAPRGAPRSPAPSRPSGGSRRPSVRPRLVGAPGRHRRQRSRRLALAGAFAVAVSSDEVDHGKPAPDVYLAAAGRLGVAPASCLVVEDSLNGVRAGKAAGMTVVLVPNASVPPAPGTAELADLVLDRLAELDPDAVA